MEERKEQNDSTIELCREIMKEINDEKLQQLKSCLLSLCDIIEKFQTDDFCMNLTSSLEIIVYHITNEPSRKNLVFDCLQNFDVMVMNIQSSKKITDELRNMFKNKKYGNEKKYDQLNLFNSDGSRCSIDEILNS